MLFRRKKKVTQPKARFYPEFKLHSHPFATTLFLDMLKEQLEDEEYLKSLLPKGKKFTREELQAGAPETMDGYWQVPRLVE